MSILILADFAPVGSRSASSVFIRPLERLNQRVLAESWILFRSYQDQLLRLIVSEGVMAD
jgi:hypothetical protein